MWTMARPTRLLVWQADRGEAQVKRRRVAWSGDIIPARIRRKKNFLEGDDVARQRVAAGTESDRQKAIVRKAIVRLLAT